MPPVVRDMSVKLPAGARCLLIGPNGAGQLRAQVAKHGLLDWMAGAAHSNTAACWTVWVHK